MAIIEETHTIEGNEITVSLLVWRRFNVRTPGLVEAVLDANPGLADNTFLPLGTKVVIPIDTDKDYEAEEAIHLWNEAAT